MELNYKQEQGLRIALERYRNREKYTVISGVAGSGKTTTVRFIISALDLYGVSEEDVVYATYTGKAAQVLARKGNKNVKTLHKLLFDFSPRPDGTFMRIPKKEIEYHIVVVDEVSMVPKSLMDLLFSHNAHIICLGDPEQLSPIMREEDHHLLDKPHIFLDEIMRQAKDSEIIRLTMQIRNHEKIEPMMGEEVRIYDSFDFQPGMLTWADQVLTATNKRKTQINKQMRKMLGFSSDQPQNGDKLICSRNYWGTCDNNDNDLINGTIGWLEDSSQLTHKLPFYYTPSQIPITKGSFKTEIDTTFKSLKMDTNMIITGEKTLTAEQIYSLRQNKKTRWLVPYEFTYGYAITVHRAQGSEWDKVLVLEESFPFDKKEHAKWLYTACTRASSRLVLVR